MKSPATESNTGSISRDKSYSESQVNKNYINNNKSNDKQKIKIKNNQQVSDVVYKITDASNSCLDILQLFDYKSTSSSIEIVVDRTKSSTVQLDSQSIGNCLYSLQYLDVADESIQELISMLAINVRECDINLITAKDIGRIIFGLHSLEPSHPSTLALVSALSAKMNNSNVVLDGMAIGYSIYGISHLSINETATKKLIRSVITKLIKANIISDSAFTTSIVNTSEKTITIFTVKQLLLALSKSSSLAREMSLSTGGRCMTYSSIVYCMHHCVKDTATTNKLLSIMLKGDQKILHTALVFHRGQSSPSSSDTQVENINGCIDVFEGVLYIDLKWQVPLIAVIIVGTLMAEIINGGSCSSSGAILSLPMLNNDYSSITTINIDIGGEKYNGECWFQSVIEGVVKEYVMSDEFKNSFNFELHERSPPGCIQLLRNDGK